MEKLYAEWLWAIILIFMLFTFSIHLYLVSRKKKHMENDKQIFEEALKKRKNKVSV
jgi:uncharacterized membrane protein